MTVVTAPQRGPAALGGEQQVQRLGVVTRKWGGRLMIAARIDGVVSPVRTSARRFGRGMPSSLPISAISRSGVSRFCWTSTASALSGET